MRGSVGSEAFLNLLLRDGSGQFADQAAKSAKQSGSLRRGTSGKLPADICGAASDRLANAGGADIAGDDHFVQALLLGGDALAIERRVDLIDARKRLRGGQCRNAGETRDEDRITDVALH
ncbi:MAG: hypothetical protein KDI53_06330 [Candidatus Accumulibacter sp.]|nr:hypothetical protein [Accumulibacter sp.]